MKIPDRFTKYPLISIAVIVLLGLIVLYAAADIFGPEWVAGLIDRRIDAMETMP